MIDLFGCVSRMTNLCERLYIITHQTTNLFTKHVSLMSAVSLVIIILLAYTVQPTTIPSADAVFDHSDKISDSEVITFEYPEKLDGWTNNDGCSYMIRPYDVYDNYSPILRQGIGVTTVLFGSQTPQWTYVCVYADRMYAYNQWGQTGTYQSAASSGSDPFTGYILFNIWPSVLSQTPISTNPFEQISHAYLQNYGLSHTLYVLNQYDDHEITIFLHGAVVTEAEFFPLDDMLKLKVYGIQSPTPNIEIKIPSELAVFDTSQGGITVNGKHFATDDTDFTLNMTEYGWSAMNTEQIIQETESWYTKLYGKQYMEQYGMMPNPEFVYDRYMNYKGNSKVPHNLVTYNNAVLEIEIPLIITNKASAYNTDHRDMSLCSRSTVPVLKVQSSSINPVIACVTPDTAQKLIQRGWAHRDTDIPQNIKDKFESPFGRAWLNSDTHIQEIHLDSFKNKLRSLPHISDVNILDTVKPSPNRLDDITVGSTYNRETTDVSGTISDHLSHMGESMSFKEYLNVIGMNETQYVDYEDVLSTLPQCEYGGIRVWNSYLPVSKDLIPTRIECELK